jgi:indolepyruvate ferredoxin oxidoreductase alpha subunit
MRLVIDASVIVQVTLAGSILGPLMGHELFAPPLMRSEALSSLSEMAYRGEIPPDAARLAVTRLTDLDVSIERPGSLDLVAWDLARSLGWAKTYDAEYVALAQILEIPLVTLDQRLRRGAGHLVHMPLPAELRA